MIEVDGQLVRACATTAVDGMVVSTNGREREGCAGRGVRSHSQQPSPLLHGVRQQQRNCTVHNTTKLLAVEHQRIPFRSKPYEVDDSNPFYRYDPDQCILCGRCVEACQNVEVNETLSINWEDPNPRVLWDGGSTIQESSCVSCGHCVTVCPCNALMEKSMLGHAGFFTSLRNHARGDDRHRQGHRTRSGFEVSEAEEAMREHRIRRTKTVCTYCGVGCSFDVWTKDRHILKRRPSTVRRMAFRRA